MSGLDGTGWTGSLNGLTIRAPNGANKSNVKSGKSVKPYGKAAKKLDLLVDKFY